MLTGTVHPPPRSPFPPGRLAHALTHQMQTDAGLNLPLVDLTGHLRSAVGSRASVTGFLFGDGTLLVTGAAPAPAAPSGLPGWLALVGRITALAPRWAAAAGVRHALATPAGVIGLLPAGPDLDGMIGNLALVEGPALGGALLAERVQLLPAD